MCHLVTKSESDFSFDGACCVIYQNWSSSSVLLPVTAGRDRKKQFVNFLPPNWHRRQRAAEDSEMMEISLVFLPYPSLCHPRIFSFAQNPFPPSGHANIIIIIILCVYGRGQFMKISCHYYSTTVQSPRPPSKRKLRNPPRSEKFWAVLEWASLDWAVKE